ncbi:MAG: NADH dehydrogenase [Candidatus Scalindua arabica]|uniref:NADH dehydrogenase n=1 Tax=Candidatus Scalindua arabica TaxID=1127984 RepID=A0A941W544_9BACT|nr:NADH dehydrogenase [Candidatus Scalindua arabica]
MFSSLIQKRRSIRKFQKNPVENEKIEILIEAALRSPSSRGYNPWEFIVVTEPDLLERLSSAKIHGSQFLKNAPLGIVVCADEDKCDVWVEDCSIASTFIFLASESIGLRSCWIQIRERMHNETITSEEYVSEVLGIPSRLKVESIIAVGYPDEKKPPHKKEELQYEKVFLNQYGKPYTSQT